ncbi:MAG: IS200/IS605 family transposase [Bacteroidia bacterium]|nr:IS200/IS605 family transposase [Bacteroidia bacterium]
MANTYTQIHIQFVFAVKHRIGLIQSSWKDELYKYITGIVQNHKHKLLAINGMPDHIHILVGIRPNQSISELMQDVKGSSSKWINERKLVPGRFEWQEGYGAFSYSASQLKDVINYIQKQEEHHKTKTFKEEYITILKKAEVDFDEQYLFKELL